MTLGKETGKRTIYGKIFEIIDNKLKGIYMVCMVFEAENIPANPIVLFHFRNCRILALCYGTRISRTRSKKPMLRPWMLIKVRYINQFHNRKRFKIDSVSSERENVH